MAELTSPFGPDVVYVYVYKGVQCGPFAGKLSALVVTSSGNVYGAGINTLVRCFMYHDDYPMQEGGGPVLSNWVKVDRLSGCGIKKFVISEGLGAGFTNDNELVSWGEGLISFVGIQSVVMFEMKDVPYTTCTICKTPHSYEDRIISGISFNYCQLTRSYPVYTSDHPPPDGVKVRAFLRVSSESLTINCTECKNRMTSLLVDSMPLIHCCSCNRLLDLYWQYVDYKGSQASGVPLYQARARSIQRDGLNDSYISKIIKDIALCSEGILLLIEQGNGFTIATFKNFFDFHVFGYSENVIITEVYTNVVRTSKGGLGWPVLPAEQGSYTITLSHISVPAKVTKVCCGWHAVACLLEDKSVWVYFPGHPPERLSTKDKEGTFEDIAAAEWCDVFYVQGNIRTEIRMCGPGFDNEILFRVSEANCEKVLLNEICSQPIPINSTIHSPPLHQPPLPQFLVGLYGKKQLSDLTLKLSDEDFPAHRSVLMSTSNYFRKTLANNTDSHATLDMSSYSPKAYKCLLKYYYQLQPDDLDLDGLIDLYVIADSYEEIDIASNVVEKLEAIIDTSNVLHAYGMSQMLNIEMIKTYCKNLMRSSKYKDKLLEMALRDPMLFLVLGSESNTE